MESKQQIEQTKKLIGNLQEQILNLKDNLQPLQHENFDLQSKNQELRVTNQDLNKRIATLQSENKAIQDATQAMRIEIETLRLERAELSENNSSRISKEPELLGTIQTLELQMKNKVITNKFESPKDQGLTLQIPPFHEILEKTSGVSVISFSFSTNFALKSKRKFCAKN